jgi:hypothetical protein
MRRHVGFSDLPITTRAEYPANLSSCAQCSPEEDFKYNRVAGLRDTTVNLPADGAWVPARIPAASIRGFSGESGLVDPEVRRHNVLAA